MMEKILIAIVISLLYTNVVYAGAEDDPLLSKVMVNQFELRSTDGSDPLVLEADVWFGYDLNKLWFKTEIERVNNETEEFELQALYSRAIAPFWEFQVGLRKDFNPKPEREWAVVGFNGLAPYFYEIDTALFIGDAGRMGFRFEAEYEILFTQQLILAPEIELNFHSKNDPETGTGSGLSNSQFGIRLRYEFVREFAPYIGINWNKKYGQTADYARTEGEEADDVQIVAGFRAWF